MPKFKRKPIVVEAFIWTGDWNQKEDPKWIVDAMKKPAALVGAARIQGDHSMKLVGKSGILTARRGDYIIKGVDGELYPCDPHVFELLHDAVDE